MYSHYLFKCLLLCCFFSILLACQSKKGIPSYVKVNFIDCSNKCDNNIDSTELVNFEISKECADCMMQNYIINGYKNALPGDSLSSVIRGFGFEDEEIRAISSIVEKDSLIQFFSMMGIYHGRDLSIFPPAIVTRPEMILQISYRPVNGNTDSIQYFNFTQPCPTFCPSIPSDTLKPPPNDKIKRQY